MKATPAIAAAVPDFLNFDEDIKANMSDNSQPEKMVSLAREAAELSSSVTSMSPWCN